MFKLESYVTPLLLSYVDKYIKNLKPEDLQLSVWEGDLVLNNLDLKLEVLEQELRLPFTFLSGHIHELRIHVPWTKLGSEPVVVSINTIECILKLADPDEPGSDSDSVKSSGSQQNLTEYKRRNLRAAGSQEAAPGYVQGMIGRITNNVSIVVTNLILKYVEDDIVLSLNIKSAESCAANADWARDFIDVAGEPPCLRRLVTMSDLTLCLDRRNASGKIEAYEDPLIYKCSLTCRMLMQYDGDYARAPVVTAVNLHCDELQFSVSDAQLPMLIRLTQLVVAMYYGLLPAQLRKREIEKELAEKKHEHPPQLQELEEQLATKDQGWAGWVYSYVPAILPTDDDDNGSQPDTSHRFSPATFIFGAYVARATILFKLTEIVESGALFGTPKTFFRPFLFMELEAGCVEMVIKGLEFTNLQIGITSGRLLSKGECSCGDRSFVDTDNMVLDPCFLKVAEQHTSDKDYNYLLRSLFDVAGRITRELPVTHERHLEEFTEQLAVERFGAFWLDYCYGMRLPDEDIEIDLGDLEHSNLQELSSLRVLFGPTSAVVSSDAVHRVQRLLAAAASHDYEPYVDAAPEEAPPPAREGAEAGEVAALLTFTPLQNANLTVLRTTRERPMYARRVVAVVSAMAPPSPDLLHHCNLHLQYNLFEFQASLTEFDPARPVKSSCVVVPKSSGAIYTKRLLLPMYFSSPAQPLTESQLEASCLRLQLSVPQLVLLRQLTLSWQQRAPDIDMWSKDSLLADAMSRDWPQLHTALVGIAGRHTATSQLQCYGVTVSQAAVLLMLNDQETTVNSVPVLESPANTKQAHSSVWITDKPLTSDADDAAVEELNWDPTEDCLSAVVQAPLDWSCDAVAVLEFKLAGVVACIDPLLFSSLGYQPRAVPVLPVTVQSPRQQSADEKSDTAKSTGRGSKCSSSADVSWMEECTEQTESKATTEPPEQVTPDTPRDMWLRQKLELLYPHLRCAVVQIDVRSVTILLPTTSLPASPTPLSPQSDTAGSIRVHLRQMYQSETLPESLVLVCPEVSVHSSGDPISTEELPVFIPSSRGASLHLPWKASICNASAYSLHRGRAPLQLLQRLSLSSTIAVAAKHMSEKKSNESELKSMGLVIHTDVDHCVLSCSEPQVMLVHRLSTQIVSGLSHISEAVKVSTMPRANVQANTTLPVPAAVSSPSQTTATSRTLKRDTLDYRVRHCCSRVAGQHPPVIDTPVPRRLAISLWMQWTVAKIAANLYGNLHDDTEFCVSGTLEDVTSSIDLQEIYQKAKLRIATMDVSHYQKRRGETSWSPGAYEGVGPYSPLFALAARVRGKSCGFPSLTFSARRVRACSAAWARRRHHRHRLPPARPPPRERCHRRRPLGRARCVGRTSGELDVTLRPLPDPRRPIPSARRPRSSPRERPPLRHRVAPAPWPVPLACATRRPRRVPPPSPARRTTQAKQSASQVDTTESGGVSRRSSACARERGGQGRGQGRGGSGSDEAGWHVTSGRLPLLYLKANTLRVFLPSLHAPRVAGRDPRGRVTSDAPCREQLLSLSTCSDMCVMEIDTVSLSPQADNPLQRLLVRKDLFQKAERARITHIPGSDIEDRQYQLDICGLGISTGLWESVVLQDEHANDSRGQNPALEWNQGFALNESVKKVIRHLPLVSKFDLRLVAAPSIVYSNYSSDKSLSSEPVLVCGHSVEVNITSDLDFYINSHQVEFVHGFVTENLEEVARLCKQSFSGLAEPNTAPSGAGVDGRAFANVNDSGVESLVSSRQDSGRETLSHEPLLSDRESVRTLPETMAEEEAPPTGSEAFVSFDLLLTAGRISVAAYSVAESEPERQAGSVEEHARGTATERRRRPTGTTDPVRVDLPILIAAEAPGSVAVPAGGWTQSAPAGTYAHGSISTASLIGEDLFEHASELVAEGLPLATGVVTTDAPSADVDDVMWEECRSAAQQQPHGSLLHSSSDEMEEASRCGRAPACKVHPFLYVLFSQPHTYVLCKPNKQKIEASCYNVVVRGGQSPVDIYDVGEKLVPCMHDYPLHWLDTKPGRADPKTGCLPNLYTITAVDFLSGLASVRIRLECPLTINLSLAKLKEVIEYYQTLDNFLKLSADTGDHHIKPAKTNIQVPTLLKYVTSVHLNTNEISVVMETMPWCASRPQLIVSVLGSDAKLNLSLCHQGTPDEILISGHVDGLMLKTAYFDCCRQFVGPVTLDASIGVLWVGDAGGAHSIPLVTLFIETEMVPLTMGQENVLCIELLLTHVHQFLKEYSSVGPAASNDKMPKSKKQCQGCVQGLDDLRTGSFEYVYDTDCLGKEPATWEIVFCPDKSTMTWRYPEPRSLTKVTIDPVPIRSTLKSDVVSEQHPMVPCVLQYWDPLRRIFLDAKDFTLSESASYSLNLPKDSLEMPASNVWRVLIIGHQQQQQQLYGPAMEVAPPFSPTVLAACMHIDSCFNPALMATVLACVSVSLLQFRLCQHPQHLGKSLPDKLRSFSLDEHESTEQEILVVSMESPTSYYKRWRDRGQLECAASISCDVVEYRNLTMMPLLETCLFQLQLEDDHGHFNCSLEMEPLVLRLGQSGVHTLHSALLAWRQMHNLDGDQVIMGSYVICNDTDEALLIGQIGTGESLIVLSGEMYAYSWRTHKHKQELKLSVEGMGGEWSPAINIDQPGSHVACITHDGIKKTLVVKIKQLTNFQKQIVVSGLLLLSSRLSHRVEVQLIVRRDEGVPMTFCYLMLGCSDTVPSCIVEEDDRVSLRVRLLDFNTSQEQLHLVQHSGLGHSHLPREGFDTPWSQELHHVTEEPELLKVPLEEKGNFVHIWCQRFCQSFGATTQRLLLLTPLFVVRTHLPQPLIMNVHTQRMHATQHVQVEGQGQEHQLWPPCGELAHSLTFQLGKNLKPSSPSLPLSVGMVEQLPKQPVSQVDIDQLCHGWQSDHELLWPYNSEDMERDLKMFAEFNKCRPHLKSAGHCEITDQPDVELQVDMAQLWPACNTLLVDVKPWCLLVNDTDWTLVVSSGNTTEWTVASGQSMAPSVIEGTFKLGLSLSGEICSYSEPIQLSDEEDQSMRYYPAIKGILCRHGYTHTTILLEQDNTKQICYLTLQSVIKHGIRVVTLTSSVAIVNNTDSLLHVKAFSVPHTQTKVNVLDCCSRTVCLPPNDGSHETASTHHLCMWDIPPPPQTVAEYVSYLTFSHAGHASRPMAEQYAWSHLVRLKRDMDGRHVIAVPSIDGRSAHSPEVADTVETAECNAGVTAGTARAAVAEVATAAAANTTAGVATVAARLPGVAAGVAGVAKLSCTECYSLTAQHHRGVLYVIVEREPAPQLLLHNNCAVVLYYGQGVSQPTEGVTVQEEAELVTQLPRLLPHSRAHYTFPSTSAHFPDVGACSKARLHLGQTHERSISWSSGVSVTDEHDQLVIIPDCSDVKVHLERSGYTMHLFIDPVTPAEFSAKEIRSRITASRGIVDEQTGEGSRRGQDTDAVSGARGNDGLGITAAPAVNVEGRLSTEQSQNGRDLLPELRGQGTVYSQLKLGESAAQERRAETEDSNQVSSSPGAAVRRAETGGATLTRICDVDVSVFLQHCCVVLLDDLGFSTHSRDVVRVSADNQQHLNVLLCVGDVQIDNQMFGQGNYDFGVVLASQAGVREHGGGEGLKPVALFLEDTFLFDVARLVDGFIPTRLSWRRRRPRPRDLPSVVWRESAGARRPVRLQGLTVGPLSLLVSAHASLKLFLASDSTPLSFGAFERRDLCTTPWCLANALLRHYAAGAALRAGWVVGSLDLLGSPTSMLREVTSGMADLFRMPYEGATHGPGSFIAGMSRGAASLLRHTSAGAITSVTNFALSVSRNMDKLSLDNDHAMRQEEIRRHKPDRLTTGLRQGLTGLGISLLGAVAGIIDQPIQVMTRAIPDSAAVTPSRAATGAAIVTGVGKGLVGVVTKPLGGAAELVSQAGLGLLHGAGWSRLPSLRYSSAIYPVSEFTNAHIKYQCKVLQSSDLLIPLCRRDVICCVEASPILQSALSPSSFLVLTPEALFVISEAEDSQQQAFQISEVDCEGATSDASLLYIIPQWQLEPLTKPAAQTKDRVAEFVDRTSALVTCYEGDRSSTSSPSLSSQGHEAASTRGSHAMQGVRYTFSMDSRLREMFLSSFAYTQASAEYMLR
ncbi:PREDICTED: vacuolar protein sorting-associated protein 13B-like [Priapulus caudatus]|uniref:Vacuolar protein sorting-associated protein 13B-like n=1 Tax=Priapulus caudatus TaxID=37621 RepID=A0ABM1EMP3_PRICU|nr:PREDICTED: vacuolar protein sorting-associated protein 13B-like [Priapulus caudatus]